jgi:hypothetical protein
MLRVRAPQSGRIKVAEEELNQACMGCEKIMHHLTTFCKSFIVAWGEFLLDEERIRMPPTRLVTKSEYHATNEIRLTSMMG